MPREGAFHHLIIVSYPRQDKRSKGNGCAIEHDFMLLTVRIHSRRVTNSATAECNMSGCMEDTSLRITSFSSDRLDGPDRYTRDFKYPPTRSLPVLNMESEEAMGTFSAC
ncbi:hypothetical protein TNCV_4173321 [Trichonephila clavipes]|nr:hypothetical protein TNCV_4173321 [Trichonephila clavipes]